MGDMTCLLPDQELPFRGHELSELPLDRSNCKEYFETARKVWTSAEWPFAKAHLWPLKIIC